LGTYILFQITWHRCNEPNPVFPKELRHLFHARFKEHGQVRSYLHGMTFLTEGCHESTKIGIDLRRPAR
jgi:hypothetical protein